LSSADPSVQEKSIAAVPSFVAEFYSDAAEAKVDQVSSPSFHFLLLKDQNCQSIETLEQK